MARVRPMSATPGARVAASGSRVTSSRLQMPLRGSSATVRVSASMSTEAVGAVTALQEARAAAAVACPTPPPPPPRPPLPSRPSFKDLVAYAARTRLVWIPGPQREKFAQSARRERRSSEGNSGLPP
eukprot:374236-Pyramimonas_sp.AAC.1